MKNEAIRVFFAVTAIFLVAMLSAPFHAAETQGSSIDRKIAALEEMTTPIQNVANNLGKQVEKKVAKGKKSQIKSKKKKAVSKKNSPKKNSASRNTKNQNSKI